MHMTEHLKKQSINTRKPLESLSKSIFSKLNISNLTTSLTHELHNFSYEGVLGTNLDMTIRARSSLAKTASETALAEIDRLEKVYSRFDPNSELNQWLVQDRTVDNVSCDLISLVDQALMWTALTEGAFHPGVDGLSKVWVEAEVQNVLPTVEEVRGRLEPTSIPFATSNTLNSTLTKHYPYGLNFNALAKGLIVDKAVEATIKQTGVKECLLNIGGDLKHYSLLKDSKSVTVSIENPFTPASNSAPYINLNINNQAVATSGVSHRSFKIAGSSYSHIIDPRTGWPVKESISTTVIASSCAMADVLATTFAVLSFKESLALANRLPNVGCHLVSVNGESISNTFFDSHIV